MNDIELIDEIVRRADEHQKQKEKEFAIAELEKVQAEIQEEIVNSRGYVTYRNALFYCYEIVDNHIKELKGENK